MIYPWKYWEATLPTVTLQKTPKTAPEFTLTEATMLHFLYGEVSVHHKKGSKSCFHMH